MDTTPANGPPSDQVSSVVDVSHRPGALRLDGFPLLTHAPGQWGDGVRTEDRGVSVADIAAVAGLPASDYYDGLARRFGTSARHVRQAVAFAIMNEG